MAKLSTCPGCTTQLALPDDATLSDRARCPRCHEEFLLMETVQFSIPTAEILSPLESVTTSPTDHLEPADHSPAVTSEPESTYETLDSLEDHDSPDEPLGTASELSSLTPPEAETEHSPLPMSATLSDWEARLKRAIASDGDSISDPVKPADAPPPIEIDNSLPADDDSPEPVTYQPHDFAVPEVDLLPEAQPAESFQTPKWSDDPFEQDAEESTVKVASDQTIFPSAIRDLPIGGANELPRIDESAGGRTTTSSRKKPRSLLRTLVSASLGVVGIPLGLYALLWLRGPAGDMLNIAQHLPSFMLPAEFSNFDNSTPQQIVQQPKSLENGVEEEIQIADGTTREAESHARLPIHQDSAVIPTSAEEVAYLGPTFALVDAVEFNALLAEAQQVAPGLGKGDLNSRESVTSKGQAYMALARLADKSTFLNQPGRSSADITSAQAAMQLYNALLHNEIVQRDMPQISLRWWQYADRPSQGFVLVGLVQRVQSTAAGDIVFVTPGKDETMPEIPILMGNATNAVGDFIGVVGSIEADPQQRLPALDTNLGPVVIAHYCFTIH